MPEFIAPDRADATALREFRRKQAAKAAETPEGRQELTLTVVLEVEQLLAGFLQEHAECKACTTAKLRSFDRWRWLITGGLLLLAVLLPILLGLLT